MWMLHFIPDSLLLWVIHGMLIAGVVGFLLSFFLLNRLLRWFPQLAPIHLLLQILSIVLLVGGVYFKGGYSTEAEWRARVAEMEQKIAEAEAKSQQTNTVIKTKIVNKIKTVKEYQIVYQDRIKEVEKIIDAECKVAPEAIIILNDAARLRKGTVIVSPVTSVEVNK
jgi:hypothetical protein